MPDDSSVRRPLDPNWFGGGVTPPVQQQVHADPPPQKDMAFRMLDLVWYCDRTGTWQPAKVTHVDLSLHPPAYQIEVENDRSIRDTEGPRLKPRAPGGAPPGPGAPPAALHSPSLPELPTTTHMHAQSPSSNAAEPPKFSERLPDVTKQPESMPQHMGNSMASHPGEHHLPAPFGNPFLAQAVASASSGGASVTNQAEGVHGLAHSGTGGPGQIPPMPFPSAPPPQEASDLSVYCQNVNANMRMGLHEPQQIPQQQAPLAHLPSQNVPFQPMQQEPTALHTSPFTAQQPPQLLPIPNHTTSAQGGYPPMSAPPWPGEMAPTQQAVATALPYCQQYPGAYVQQALATTQPQWPIQPHQQGGAMWDATGQPTSAHQPYTYQQTTQYPYGFPIPHGYIPAYPSHGSQPAYGMPTAGAQHAHNAAEAAPLHAYGAPTAAAQQPYFHPQQAQSTPDVHYPYAHIFKDQFR
jgi:hypothetical protein